MVGSTIANRDLSNLFTDEHTFLVQTWCSRFLCIQGKDKSKTLSDVTPDMIKTGEKLRGIDDKKIECLQTFVKCKPLIQWLKEELKGKKKIKNFIFTSIAWGR